MEWLEELNYDELAVRLAKVRNTKKTEKLVPEVLREAYEKLGEDEREAVLKQLAEIRSSKKRWELIMEFLRETPKPLKKTERDDFWERLYQAAWEKSGKTEIWLLDLFPSLNLLRNQLLQ